MFAISLLSVGLPALIHALFNLSAVILDDKFLPTVFALAPTAAAPFLSAPPAAAAPFLIASSGPSVKITAGDPWHHSNTVSILSVLNWIESTNIRLPVSRLNWRHSFAASVSAVLSNPSEAFNSFSRASISKSDILATSSAGSIASAACSAALAAAASTPAWIWSLAPSTFALIHSVASLPIMSMPLNPAALSSLASSGVK